MSLGVATRLGRAYSLISSRRLFAQTVQSGFEWLSYHVQHLDRLVFYQCQDYQSDADAIKESDVGAQVRQCILQQVVTKHQFQPAVLHQTNVGIKRTGNQCMEYLFNVADTSEPCDINWLGTRHMIYPLRDSENVAFGLVDLYVRSDNAHEKTSQWLAQLTEHLNTMLGILNLTYGQLVIRTGLETMDRLVLGEMELNKSNQQDADYISGVENQIPFETAFEYFIAGELHKIRCLISDEIVNELSTYTNPPSIIVKLVDTSLSLTEVEKTQHERTGQWSDYRRMINKRWQNQVLLFDPTNARAAINLRNLDQLFSDDIQNEVDQCQSKAAKILYQWMRCCRTVSHIQSSMDKE